MSGPPEQPTFEDAQNANPTTGTSQKNNIPHGYCQCGCGQKAPLAKQSANRFGHIKGAPVKYIAGHNARMQPIGDKSRLWKGGVTVNNEGRKMVYAPQHARANANKCVPNYFLVVERATGKPIPKTAVVHHVNGNTSDDSNSNLVVCESDAYHRLLHQRERALRACGNANWRKCQICGHYSPTDLLYMPPSGKSPIYHKQCKSESQKTGSARKKVNNEALEDFKANGISEEMSKQIITLVAKGLIRNVKIQY